MTWGDVHERYLASAVRFVDDFEGWVHYECVLVEKPNVGRVGELGHRVAHGDHFCPGEGCAFEVVVPYFREESFVACRKRPWSVVLWQHKYCKECIPCFSAYCILFSLTASRYSGG